MNKNYAILGLGSYGKYLAENLYAAGADVLIADSDEELVSQFADKCTYAVTADLSDPEAIKALGIKNMDVVIICMGQSLGPSVMCTMVSKEQGVPLVIAKSTSKQMEAILYKVGADKVINIEEDAAYRAARRFLSDNFLDYFDFGDNLAIVDLYAKSEWVGKNLKELHLREKYNINVIAVKSDNEMSSHIDPTVPLQRDSRLVVVGDKEDIARL